MLFSQNVRNGANIMLMLSLQSVVAEEDAQTKMSDRVHETRKVAEALAKRKDGKSWNLDVFKS